MSGASFGGVCALSFTLGAWLGWRLMVKRSMDEVRATCGHAWREPASLYNQRREWFRHCARCGAQQHGETEKGPWRSR